jgi:hypothetical protein
MKRDVMLRDLTGSASAYSYRPCDPSGVDLKYDDPIDGTAIHDEAAVEMVLARTPEDPKQPT